MHGRWRIAHQYAGGEMFIRVFRLRDAFGVDHSGNREYVDAIFDSDAEAQAYADRLNKGEENENA